MADTTTSGKTDAVKAVVGDVDRDEVHTTHDLKSEQDKDKKLDERTTKAQVEVEEPKQLATRKLNNGKTEAILEEGPAVQQFVPDDGGYNPERRFYAGPDDTKVPSAVGKNRTTPRGLPEGWKEDHLTAAGKKEFNV